MSKYKFRRYFRSYSITYALFNLLITLVTWSLIFLFDTVCFLGKHLYRFVKYLIVYKHYKKINYTQDDIVRMIKNMTPREFEIFIAELFKVIGYEVELTPETADGGKDCILFDGAGRKIYVEMKHYSENNFVGREICQKITGAMTIDGADECIIVTTGRYNNNAYECAEKYDKLTLMDFDDILLMLRKIDVHLIPRLFVKTFNGDGRKLALDY